MIFRFDERCATGFCSTILPDGNASWTLPTVLRWLLVEAEKHFGHRDKRWTFIGIEFCGSKPMVWFPGDADFVAIRLSEGMRGFPTNAIFELAHEVVHLLSPGKNSTVLEEGIATLFQYEVAAQCHIPAPSTLDPRYARAKALVEPLMHENPHGIRDIRKTTPEFYRIDAAALRSAFPSLDDDTAELLLSPFKDLAEAPNSSC